MVHVNKCPCEYGRGKPTTEFYIKGKPQTYCNGWQDGMTDEVIAVCRNCKDWVYGEQCEKDWENYRNSEQYKIDHSEVEDGNDD